MNLRFLTKLTVTFLKSLIYVLGIKDGNVFLSIKRKNFLSFLSLFVFILLFVKINLITILNY